MTTQSIAILALDNVYASSLATYSDAVQVACSHLRHAGSRGHDHLRTLLVSPNGRPVVASNGMRLETVAFADIPAVDAVVVPGLNYPGRDVFEQRLAASHEVYRWLRQQAERGIPMVGNCTGTALLAEAGLLDGRAVVTTPWWVGWFQRRYPRVRLQVGQPEAADGKFWTTSTPSSCLLQALMLVSHFCGRSVAALCARTLSEEAALIGRFQCGMDHHDGLVAEAQQWLVQHFSTMASLNQLAERLCVSERTLSRRFNRAIGMGPGAYLQKMRIDSACHLLRSTQLSVSDIAWQVGYADASAFTRRFRSRLGVSPGRFRQQQCAPGVQQKEWAQSRSAIESAIPFRYERLAN